ncbi:unnamed protein product [Musa acuminata var. zebrina]
MPASASRNLPPPLFVDRLFRLPEIAILFASLRSGSRKMHHRRAREKAVAVPSLSDCSHHYFLNYE